MENAKWVKVSREFLKEIDPCLNVCRRSKGGKGEIL